MADINFSELGLTVNSKIQTLEWNGQTIEVKKYLPIEDKMTLIEKIVNNSIDDNGFYNPIRIYINLLVETVLAYSNIKVSPEQKDDILNLFDLLTSSGLADMIFEEGIDPWERETVEQWVEQNIVSIYKYKDSVLGILDTISEDYKNLDFDIQSLKDKLSDPEELSLVKDILTKLG